LEINDEENTDLRTKDDTPEMPYKSARELQSAIELEEDTEAKLTWLI